MAYTLSPQNNNIVSAHPQTFPSFAGVYPISPLPNIFDAFPTFFTPDTTVYPEQTDFRAVYSFPDNSFSGDKMALFGSRISPIGASGAPAMYEVHASLLSYNRVPSDDNSQFHFFLWFASGGFSGANTLDFRFLEFKNPDRNTAVHAVTFDRRVYISEWNLPATSSTYYLFGFGLLAGPVESSVGIVGNFSVRRYITARDLFDPVK